jgi:hypothetical protein
VLIAAARLCSAAVRSSSLCSSSCLLGVLVAAQPEVCRPLKWGRFSKKGAHRMKARLAAQGVKVQQ